MITSRTTSKNFSLLTLTFTFLFLLSSCSASQTDSIVGNWSSSLYFHNNEWVDDDSVFCQINNGGNAFLKFSFDNKDDAIKARLIAEKKYFGDFAPQKHLYEKYNIS